MAEEAAVENLPFNRFFCHKCSREIQGVLNDFKCPNCQCGFIELLENHPDQNDESDQDADSEMPAPFEDMLSEMLSDAGYRLEERRGGRPRRSSRTRGRNQLPIENLLQDFIVNLTSWGGSNTIGVGTARTGTPGGHLLLMANPGDYAWGREGLDAIVTQLLNQMDTTGPPPLAKEKISQIPVAMITKEQQDTNLQCSVCWEDFKVDEPVRKLPCEHVYHDNCIIPWLELHGTCPICRKTLTDDGRVEDPDNSSNVVGNSLATLLRYARTTETSNSRTSSSSSSSSGTGSTGSTSSSNTNSSRPDFNMDIDFD